MAETKEQFQARSAAPTSASLAPRYEHQSGGINTLAYEPTSIDEAFKMAGLLVASGLTPRGMDTPQKAFLVMAQGRELGLSTMQALNNIYVVEGKVSLSSDLMAALVMKSPVCEYLRVTEMSAERATYAAKRKGGAEFKFSYTWEDAKRAGLASKATYQSNPADMLRHRALSKTVRAVFPDIVSGLYARDEVDDAVVDVTPRAATTESVGTVTVLPPAESKVRRRENAEPQPSAPAAAPQQEQLEQASETSEAPKAVAAPHRNEGAVIDPLTGELLEGDEAKVFAFVGDASTPDQLVEAQGAVAEAKKTYASARYDSLAWLYFFSRKVVLGRDAPEKYVTMRAI